MGLKRHRKMKFGVNEAADEEFRVALESEDFELNGVHESVKQAALGHFVVKDDNVKESQGMHVGEFGKVGKPRSFCFRVKGGIGNAIAVEFDHSHLIEQSRRKIGPHEGFLVLGERSGGMEIAFAPVSQIGRDEIDRLTDPFFGELNDRFGFGFQRGDFAFDGGVIFAERSGGLEGLAENITLSEAGQIVGRKAEAKLVRGAMGAEQFELRLA